ncbi:MAG: hypothetical protein DWQ05_16390 [Calditrichaeota bacterium]|nr:MAG: hypothetical protein DWQ05_16390 [Calditrichota bacterium]
MAIKWGDNSKFHFVLKVKIDLHEFGYNGAGLLGGKSIQDNNNKYKNNLFNSKNFQSFPQPTKRNFLTAILLYS